MPAVGLLLVAALALVGIWADFIPTESWALASKICTLLVSIPFVWFLWKQPARYNRKSPKSKLVTLLVAPWICYLLILPATLSGLPYITTFIIGNDGTRVESLVKQSPRRKGCKHRMGGALLKPAFSRYICVTPEQFSRFPHRGSYTLYVRESPLGYIVHHIQYRPPFENPERLFKSPDIRPAAAGRI